MADERAVARSAAFPVWLEEVVISILWVPRKLGATPLAGMDIARSTFDEAIARVMQRSSSLQGLAQFNASLAVVECKTEKWEGSKTARWRRSAMVSWLRGVVESSSVERKNGPGWAGK